MGSQTVPLSDLSDEPLPTIAVGSLLDAPPKPQTSSGALVMAATRPTLGAVQSAATEVATNPNIRKIGSAVGQAAGALAGAKTGNPLNVAGGMWAGGRAGWHTGALAQKVAAPVAKVLDAVAPYAQALSTLSGAQGALDVAQMAEPARQDIGVLGVTMGQPRSAEEKAAHPALLNLALEKVSDAIKYLMDRGMPQGEAVRTVMNARARGQ